MPHFKQVQAPEGLRIQGLSGFGQQGLVKGLTPSLSFVGCGGRAATGWCGCGLQRSCCKPLSVTVFGTAETCNPQGSQSLFHYTCWSHYYILNGGTGHTVRFELSRNSFRGCQVLLSWGVVLVLSGFSRVQGLSGFAQEGLVKGLTHFLLFYNLLRILPGAAAADGGVVWLWTAGVVLRLSFATQFQLHYLCCYSATLSGFITGLGA